MPEIVKENSSRPGGRDLARGLVYQSCVRLAELAEGLSRLVPEED